MYPDFLVDYCLFGGGADGVSGDAILCASVLYLCGTNDSAVWVFAVVVVDGASGGIGAGAVSDEGTKDGVRVNDGAAGEVYPATGGADYCAGYHVGSNYVAANSV